ncbi:hypothetical protein BJ138DRAFT_561170 [Hygrophoropsis aurantiaca]|uniref:Uncharacterized protein n=1 Tax=Hygrophoropsis aurantiaca TaxID=72124 RepID=A0ACB8AKE3_9AGAM|nr:hypothetical protein BJ138DRAFT_561170 [Hygrophoropsis aurantiaca]
MSSADDNHIELCKELLKGYVHTELPDLSYTRVHNDPAVQSTIRPLDTRFGPILNHSVASAFALAALSKLLGQYCNVSDILIGVSAAAISDSYLPVRISWDENTTWKDIISSVLRTLDRAEPWVSLSAIRQVLDLNDKQIPFVALFQVNADPGRTGHATRAPFLSTCIEDQSLSLYTTPERIHLSVANQLLSQIAALISHAVIHPTSQFSLSTTLPADLLSVTERLSKRDRSRFYSHIPPVRIATDYFLPHVRDYPDAPAVGWYPSLSQDEPIDGTEFESEFLTYKELHHAANRFSRWLLARGLQTEDRVALCMDRNLHFHIAMIGIMRAGGCYVPIDPELPTERKSYIASDSGARFVLLSTPNQSPDVFGDVAIDIAVDDIQQEIESMSDADLDIATSEGLAFMLYTSGTTGNPKGCLLTHEGLTEVIWSLSSFAADVRLDNIRDGRYLGVASIAFDVHIQEFLVPLALGMVFLCAPRTLLLENLPFYLKHLEISHVGIVPSLIDATMGAMEEEEMGDGMKLRYIASGGEKMSDSILDKWAGHPKVKLANYYGPSEVTIGCAGRYMDPSTPKGNIGPAFANVDAYVVDTQLNILPRGSIGELVVAGPLVGRGYQGRSDLTAKAFLEWPYPGSWAYRTGDLVRMMPDGTLEIAGRIDTQIKLRGVRIEAEGVSAVLQRSARASFGLTADVGTVLGTHEAIGGGSAPQLVSFIAWDTTVPIVTRRTSKPHVISPLEGLMGALRSACERELASYMRPSHVIPLSWLPLNANGKADGKVLSRLFGEVEFDTLLSLTQDATAGASRDAIQRPPTDLEKTILALLETRCKISPDTLNVQSNFFACGMDSLSLVRLSADIKKSIGTPISAADMMRLTTVEAVAEFLQAAGNLSTSSSLPSAVESFSSTWRDEVIKTYSSFDVESILPPLPIQEGVLYTSEASPNMFVQHVVMRVQNCQIPKLHQSWEDAMKEIEILRTVFFFTRAFVQVVLRPEACQLRWTDKSTPVDDRALFSEWFFEEEAEHIAEQINSSVSSQPPFGITAYCSAQSAYIVLSIHHALFDGISLPQLLKCVEDIYHGKTSPKAPPMAHILDAMSRVDANLASEYWNTTFAGFNWNDFSFKTPSPSVKPTRKIIPFSTPLSTFNAKLATHKITLQALLTCAHASLLANHVYHRSDVVFGVIRSGRLLPVDGVDGALCPTLSVLPARVDFAKPGGVLQNIQSDISSSVQFESISLGKVQSWINPGDTLFDTLFSVSVKDETHYDAWEVLKSELPRPDFVLSVEVIVDVVNDSLVLHSAYYDTDLESGDIEGLLSNFEKVALGIAESGKPQIAPNIVHHPIPRAMIPGESTQLEGLPESSDSDEDDQLRALKVIVAQFLQVPSELLAAKTSLIALGLDSIKSVGLSRTLRAEGFSIPAMEILRRPSLSELKKFILASSRSGDKRQDDRAQILFREECGRLASNLDLQDIMLSENDEVRVFPATVLQAGMLSQTVNSSGKLYVHGFPLELEKDVDVDRLQQAWRLAVDRFDILRTTFHFCVDLGSWAQVIHSFAQLNWAEELYHPSDSVDGRLNDILSSVHLSNETAFHRPPVFLRLWRPDAEDAKTYLVLVMHHALYDGLSFSRLLEEVDTAYHTQDSQNAPQFADVLPQVFEQERMGTSFWAQRLRGYHPEPPKQLYFEESGSSHAVSRTILLDPVTLDNLFTAAAVTPQCLGQAALAKLLSELTSSRDIVFGHVVSGRSSVGSEDVIGPLLNTIPCRVRFTDSTTNRELLRSVQRDNVAALQWQHASLRAIQSRMNTGALWNSLFLFQPTRSSGPVSSLWKLSDSSELEAKVQYPLNIEFYQVEAGFFVKAVCLPSFNHQEGLSQTLDRLEEILRGIVDRLDERAVADLANLPASVNISPSIDPSTPAAQTPTLARDQPVIPPAFLDVLSSVTHRPAETLDLDRSLAALGIDSISAIQLSAKCRKAGISLSIADIIASRTVRDIVAKLDVSDPATPRQPSQSIPTIPLAEQKAIMARFPEKLRSAIDTVTPVTSGMKWLIAAWQRSGGTRAQHVFPYKLPADFDAAKLSASWKELLRRHAILRSTFASAENTNEPRLITFKSDQIGDLWVEESLGKSLKDENALAVKMREIVSSSLPLSEPQSKAFLLHSTQETYLLLRMHHFQYDAWSLQLIVDDLSRIYHDKPSSVSTNLGSFQAGFSGSPEQLEEQRQYWQTVMPSPFQPVYFPPMYETYESAANQRTICTVRAAVSGAAGYEERARAHDLSLQVVLLACWASAQSSYTSTDSATFGLWHAGRTGSVDDIDKLALPCMNVLPLHVPIHGSSAIDVARHIQEDLRRRTAVVEQSDLEMVDRWVGADKQPLGNVFVNVVKVAPDIDKADQLLKPVLIPYFLPDSVPKETEPVLDRLSVTELLQDDIMIDIVTDEELDTIALSIECASNMMSQKQAEVMIDRWSEMVQDCWASAT